MSKNFKHEMLQRSRDSPWEHPMKIGRWNKRWRWPKHGFKFRHVRMSGMNKVERVFGKGFTNISRRMWDRQHEPTIVWTQCEIQWMMPWVSLMATTFKRYKYILFILYLYFVFVYFIFVYMFYFYTFRSGLRVVGAPCGSDENCYDRLPNKNQKNIWSCRYVGDCQSSWQMVRATVCGERTRVKKKVDRYECRVWIR